MSFLYNIDTLLLDTVIPDSIDNIRHSNSGYDISWHRVGTHSHIYGEKEDQVVSH